MRGPPPTPTHLKLIRGNPGKRPIRPEPEPEIPPEVLEAPPYLVSYAADEWHRLAGELHRLKLLTVVDVHLFACYCEAYRAWRTAGEALSAMAARDPLTGGLMVKSQNGNAMQNPLFLTMRQAAKDMLRYAGEFGSRLSRAPGSQRPVRGPALEVRRAARRLSGCKEKPRGNNG
jgi:P27 family predicted phage terminase small subunit